MDIQEVKLGELYIVTVLWQYGNGIESRKTEHIVRRVDLDKLVAAYKELHYEPGVNPANKEKTAVIWEIKAAPFRTDGPYWWTTPGLARNDDPAGVVLFKKNILEECVIWRHPDYQAHLNKLDDEEQD